MDLKDLQRQILQFRDERDWSQFHTAKNLAMSVSIEAGELLQEFQWLPDGERLVPSEEKRSKISDELADVAIYLILLASETNIDLEVAIKQKLVKNAEKYPVEKSKGTSKKYTEL